MDSIKSFADKTKQTISSKVKKPSSPTETDNSSLVRDEENPFDEESTSSRLTQPQSSQKSVKSKSESQVQQPPKPKKSTNTQTINNKSAYNNNNNNISSDGTGLTASELSAREQEIKAREDKLLAMEKQLEKRSAEVEKLAGKMKNWPSKCYPILYHSIEDEIPLPMQKIVRRFYYFWIFLSITLITNWVATIIIWAQTGNMSIIDILLATFYIVSGIPGAWVLWYRPFYKTMKSKSSVSWSFFIMGFTFHWLYVICMGISVPWFAGAGLLIFIKTMVSGYTLSIIMNLVAMLLSGLAWLITGYLTKKARDEYKAAGQNLAAMKSGFVGEAIKMQIRG